MFQYSPILGRSSIWDLKYTFFVKNNFFLIICFEIHRSAESKRALWKIGDVSNAAAQGTLRAKFELTEGPSKPSTLAVQFSSEGTTLSGLDIDLLNTSYRLSLIKKRFTSGKNLS